MKTPTVAQAVLNAQLMKIGCLAIHELVLERELGHACLLPRNGKSLKAKERIQAREDRVAKRYFAARERLVEAIRRHAQLVLDFKRGAQG